MVTPSDQDAAIRPPPAALGVVAEQDLGDRQTDQLGVRQPAAARSAAWLHQPVDGDIHCDDEVVERPPPTGISHLARKPEQNGGSPDP
jgi:hypothetical protein